MRTTLDIADDVLSAAKDLAKAEGKTMGQVISDLARHALTAPRADGISHSPEGQGGFAEAQTPYIVDDWPMFPRRDGSPVTADLIRRIEDELDLEDAAAFDHQRNAPRKFDGE